ncbi:LOW QUALITY PROTEIN: hypothetical protein Q4I28_001579 [Leishmania naiffi]|uniref:Uncharacterized protein n=1 Tax=Leishmania naiffi TaxID=5678 RepID=A0AAW3C579_9TRYP
MAWANTSVSGIPLRIHMCVCVRVCVCLRAAWPLLALYSELVLSPFLHSPACLSLALRCQTTTPTYRHMRSGHRPGPTQRGTASSCRGAWQRCVRFFAPIRRCMSYSSSATLPPPLSFSVELSLPHLPGRTPFVAAAGRATRTPIGTCSGAVHRSTHALDGTQTAKTEESAASETKSVMTNPEKRVMSTEELIACLRGLPGSSPASPLPLVSERWLQFVHLCDSLVQFATCPSERDVDSSTTSKRPGAPRHSLVGVVMPCKETYFSARHVDAAAASTLSPILASDSPAPSYFAEDMSTTQAALFLFRHHWRVPVTLTISTTVPNCTPGATESRGCSQPLSPAGHDAAHAVATPGGIDAVVADFVFVHGGSRLLLVRGDTPSDLPLCFSADSSNGPLTGALSTMTGEVASPSQRVHGTLRAGTELVRHVSAWKNQQQKKPFDGCSRVSALELCVAGYPQGHPLDRTWSTTSAPYSFSTEVAATGAAATNERSIAARRQRSLEFLRAFEKDFDAATYTLTAAACITESRACVVSAEKSSSNTSINDGAPSVASGEFSERARHFYSQPVVMPELQELCRTLGRLKTVRRLWTSSSRYEPDVRAACTRQMLQEKVRLRSPEAPHLIDGSIAAAAVIVTQMVTTARELTDYVEEIQRGLRAWDATAAGGEQPEPTSGVRTGDGHQQLLPSHAAAPATLTPISVIPGVLLPHPTDVHVLLRSLYYSKVIPSARMQQALEVYASELMNAWRQLAGEHPWVMQVLALRDDTLLQTLTESDIPAATLAVSKDRVAQVEARARQMQRSASSHFTSAWLSETVDLLHDLQQHGQTRLHLFTISNDKVDVRVAQLLAAYDAQRGASAEQ